MKTAAILCPGPSLARYSPGDFVSYEFLVGVNRAPLRIACDAWAAGDWPLVEQVRCDVLPARFSQPPRPPVWFTTCGADAHLRDHSTVWPGKVEIFETLFDGHQDELQWTTFTATAALWWVASKMESGGVIRLYGADWKGEEDYDGVKAGNTRDESRWQLERGIWNRLTDVLKGRGIIVSRVTAAEESVVP